MYLKPEPILYNINKKGFVFKEYSGFCDFSEKDDDFNTNIY
jgi:hypothetical protein